jgi:hypothetical protein
MSIAVIGGSSMIGENEERWKVLCAQAAKEQDPAKLHELIHEINNLLAAKERRLKGALQEDKTKE